MIMRKWTSKAQKGAKVKWKESRHKDYDVTNAKCSTKQEVQIKDKKASNHHGWIQVSQDQRQGQQPPGLNPARPTNKNNPSKKKGTEKQSKNE